MSAMTLSANTNNVSFLANFVDANFVDHIPGVTMAEAICDVGQIANEMAMLVETTGALLTSELRPGLQAALPQ